MAKAFVRPGSKGYCSKQSVRAGETIDVMVSTDPPRAFQVEIFRMGYYGGRGARLLRTIGPLMGQAQPVPEVGAQEPARVPVEAEPERDDPARLAERRLSRQADDAGRSRQRNPTGRATSSSSCAISAPPTSSFSARTIPGRPITGGRPTTRFTPTPRATRDRGPT